MRCDAALPYNSMALRFVIVIPARGGSKRIPRKNLALLGGKPLLEHTADQLRQAKVESHASVSTEDAGVAAESLKHGLHVIDRPAGLAADNASTEAVLLHALDALEKEGKTFDWVMTLPVTSPFRTAATIQRFIREAEDAPADIDSFFSVTERVERLWKRKEDGTMHMVFPKSVGNQQERRLKGLLLYEENSAVYLTRVTALRRAADEGAISPIFGENTKGIVIDAREGMDINTETDLRMAEAIFPK